MLTWKQAAPEFYADGSLRDLYVLGATIDGWQALLDSLRASTYSYRYTRAKVEAPLPERASDAFPDLGFADRLLAVDLGGFAANCHFFSETEIEFDLDPREVSCQAHLDAILDFIQFLASATSRDAILTPENQPEIVIFRARPGIPEIEHQPFGGYS
jgi:hypothetical protein